MLAVTNADADQAAVFFFLSAQRFFMASPILFRAAADRYSC
jgi:D-serine deaminase-like pyridoxal phosphate-dependent protein